MVQIAVPLDTNGVHAFLFDLVEGKGTEGYAGLVALLRDILENQQKEKLFHDCRWYAHQLAAQFGIYPKNVIDTQVGNIACIWS